jgi:hypothetical protein
MVYDPDDPIKPVKITRHEVFIGGQQLPGAIAEDGIVVKPGGYKGINLLTVTLLVGEVEMVDPTRDEDSTP